MPQSIPKGIAASHVLLDLPDLDAGVEHPFGAPTGYELVHQGKRYPPKAVIGFAFRHLGDAIFPPEQFSGEAPGRSNFVLRGLGFTVEMKGEAVAEPAETKEWTAEEVSLIVADYFVLRASVRRHRRALRSCLWPYGGWIGSHAAAPGSLLNGSRPRPVNAYLSSSRSARRTPSYALRSRRCRQAVSP